MGFQTTSESGWLPNSLPVIETTKRSWTRKTSGKGGCTVAKKVSLAFPPFAFLFSLSPLSN